MVTSLPKQWEAHRIYNALSAAMVKAVSLDEGTGGALTSAPLSKRTRPTSA